MTLILVIGVILLAFSMALVSFVQLLYLESLRLRARELPALEFFKESLEDKLRLKLEDGALAFSLLKHSGMVLLGILFCAIAARGAFVGWPGLAEAAFLGVGAMLASAYIAPQLLYRKTGAAWLTPLVPLLRLLAWAPRLLASFVSFLENLLSLGEPPVPADDNSSSEHLEALIEAGADEGLIEEQDRKLIHSVIALGDKTVREVMTARPNIVAIRQEATIEDFRALVTTRNYSRIPVFEDCIDNIKGFAHVRDILAIDYDQRSVRTVAEFIRPTLFVPETKPVAELFREMQRASIHMVIVVDEYGETAGIATMEDVVEEVFGEIHDEYDSTADVKEESPGVYLLSGAVDLDQLQDLLEYRPDEETESTTVGGLITEWLGHVPAVGEAGERSGICIEVTAGDERHVQQVRVRRAEPRNGNGGSARKDVFNGV